MAVLNHEALYLTPNRTIQSRTVPTIPSVMPIAVAYREREISAASATCDAIVVASANWGKARSMPMIETTIPNKYPA